MPSAYGRLCPRECEELTAITLNSIERDFLTRLSFAPWTSPPVFDHRLLDRMIAGKVRDIALSPYRHPREPNEPQSRDLPHRRLRIPQRIRRERKRCLCLKR
jgi:hypothetical protein